MTVHDHAEYVSGCFRCDLSHYEHMRDSDPDPMPRMMRVNGNGDEPWEIRYKHGELDEIVANNVSVHIEKMDDGYWWMSMQHPAEQHRRLIFEAWTVNPRAKSDAQARVEEW